MKRSVSRVLKEILEQNLEGEELNEMHRQPGRDELDPQTYY